MFETTKLPVRTLMIAGVLAVGSGARAAPYSLQLPDLSDFRKGDLPRVPQPDPDPPTPIKVVAPPRDTPTPQPPQLPLPPVGPGVHLEPVAEDPNLSASYAESWGRNDRFSAYVDTSFANHASRQRRSTHAAFAAGGYAFGRRIALIEAKSDINRGSGTSYSYLAIMGDKKWSSSSPTPIYEPAPWRREGPSVRQRFMVGPVPVSVGAGIGGVMRFTLGVATPADQPHAIEVSAMPSVAAYGEADAAVDLVLARAGVQGSLTIVEDRVPAALTVSYAPDSHRVTSRLKVENSLRTLNGRISIYAKVRKPWGGWKKWSKKLFSWKGLSRNWTLIDESVSATL